jgi:ParB family transcriptional regulator, chromosome partitioning protein
MSKTKFGLGKGLGALIPGGGERDDEHVSVVPGEDTRDDGVAVNVLAHVELRRIAPNPHQPRMEFDPQALQELADSIREKGLVQPVTVRRFGEGYQLISGERRLRACQAAGITHIPAYIRQVESDEEMLELALIENIQRETLNPIEIAFTYQRLIEEFHYTQDQVAQRVSKNRTTVTNFVRLLRLPREIQDSIQKGEISMGHARALITIPDQQRQLRIWKKIVREGLSVRIVEDIARESLAPLRPKPARETRAVHPPQVEDMLTRLRARYGTKVHLAASKDGRGALRFEFYNASDFERLMELLLAAVDR